MLRPSRESIDDALHRLHIERVREPGVVALRAEISVPGSPFPIVCRAELAGYDSVYAEFWAPLGIMLGQLRMTPETLEYYDAMRNTVLIARPTIELTRQALGIPLTYESVLALLRQRPPLPHRPDSIAWIPSRSLLILWDSAGARLEFQLPAWELCAYELRVSPETSLRIEYSQWHAQSPVYAEHVRLTTPTLSAAIDVRDFRFLDAPSGAYALKVSSNARRIVLE